MANIKKHFGFKVGCGSVISSTAVASTGILQSPQNATTDLLLPSFSKSAFMNEVSSLLDHCGLYVAAMNGFCTSGCSLAKCLVKVFHAVPLYRDTASTLLSNWEEIAQTTAAASASVKTEALMQLQDVLTRLEGHSAENREVELTESVHAVSSCLMAYIELQAQFSYSVFKALGKLSRQQSGQPSGFLKNSTRAEEAVRKHFAQIINRLTGPSAKTPTSPTTPTTPTPVVPQAQPTAYPSTGCGSIWPAEIHLAPSSGELSSVVPKSSAPPTRDGEDSGLNDVINLLSIGGTSALTSAITSAAPPKVPPRPDALSQDAFRVKRQQQQHDPKTEDQTISSWSPFAPTQWGNPDWVSDDLTNSWKTDPQLQSSDVESDPSWVRWQASIENKTPDSGLGSGAKEKTSTWPRPFRERTAPWDPSDANESNEELLASENLVRDCGERAKTCTWPLKMDDGAWSIDPATLEQWDDDEAHTSTQANLIPPLPGPHYEPEGHPAWEPCDGVNQQFHLFTPRN